MEIVNYKKKIRLDDIINQNYILFKILVRVILSVH